MTVLALYLLGCIYVTATIYVDDTADSGSPRPRAPPPGETLLAGDSTLYDPVDYAVDDHVVLRWRRSTEPDRFVAPPGCWE